MAQKIYNNGSDGKILMSSAGKVIRQPYEFGNAFQNRMGLNNYIDIKGVSLSHEMEVVNYCSNEYSIQSINYIINIQTSNFDNYNLNSYYGGSTTKWIAVSKNSADAVGSKIFRFPPTTQIGKSFVFFNITQTAGYGRLNNLAEVNGLVDASLFNVNRISIGASRPSNGEILTGFSNTDIKHSRILIYNREISESEKTYIVNNLLGSDPQSTAGIYIDIRCHKAEILNTGGADFVGVRDYSGNNHHGEIMNLPAGTLEYKRDYANTNLFVPFLT